MSNDTSVNNIDIGASSLESRNDQKLEFVFQTADNKSLNIGDALKATDLSACSVFGVFKLLRSSLGSVEVTCSVYCLSWSSKA
jgi:hypothetical protein